MDQGARQHKVGQQDAEAGQDEDFHQLQAAAMQSIDSQKIVVPTPSRKNMKEIDVRKLTKSQKNMMLDQALQVLHIYISCRWGSSCLGNCHLFPTDPGSPERCKFGNFSALGTLWDTC